MRHGEDAEVYINGVLAVTSPGLSRIYAPYALSPEALASLHPGENTFAVHVRHEDFEAHFADLGLVDVLWPESEKAGQ